MVGRNKWVAPRAAQDVITAFRTQGIRFNIVTPVGYRIELHYAYRVLNGNEKVAFVAELDSYGNITEWGPGMTDVVHARKIPDKGIILNADGEELRG